MDMSLAFHANPNPTSPVCDTEGGGSGTIQIPYHGSKERTDYTQRPQQKSTF